MCHEANRLKMNWYQTRQDLDRLLYEAHRRECDKCRREMAELTRQAEQAEMPELESEQ